MSDRKFTQERSGGKSQPSQGLALLDTPRKSPAQHRSSDPYNTSGSFDRSKNWARVGKR